MSLSSQTSVDLLTIRRLDPTERDEANAPVESYTTGARGALPTELLSRALPMSAKELMQYGIEGDVVGWKFLVSVEDPQVRSDDVVDFTDSNGTAHTIEVQGQAVNLAGLSRLWMFTGVERSTVQ